MRWLPSSFSSLCLNYSRLFSFNWNECVFVFANSRARAQDVFQCSYVTYLLFQSHALLQHIYSKKNNQPTNNNEQKKTNETKTNLIGSTFNNQLFKISLCIQLTVTVFIALDVGAQSFFLKSRATHSRLHKKQFHFNFDFPHAFRSFIATTLWIRILWCSKRFFFVVFFFFGIKCVLFHQNRLRSCAFFSFSLIRLCIFHNFFRFKTISFGVCVCVCVCWFHVWCRFTVIRPTTDSLFVLYFNLLSKYLSP